MIAENDLNVDVQHLTEGQCHITLGSSAHWFNGDNRAPLKPNSHTGELSSKYAESRFNSVHWTDQQIVAHILSGRAITPAHFKNNWRKGENYISAQLIGIDFDDDTSVTDLAVIPFVQQFGFFIHATKRSTPEAPRSRVYFMLDTLITDPTVYKQHVKRLAHGLAAQLGKKADEQCADAARRFFGCANAEHIVQLQVVLPLAVLELLPPHPDEIKVAKAELQRAEYLRTRAEENTNPEYAAHYAESALESEARTLASAVKGNRHHQNMKSAFAIGQLVGAGVLDYNTAYYVLHNASLAAGRLDPAAERDTREGLAAGMRQPRLIPPPRPSVYRGRSEKSGSKLPVAEAVIPPSVPAFTPLPDDLLDGIPDIIHVNIPKVSNLPLDMFEKPGVYIIRSGADTGKTELAARLQPDRAISHRQALTANMASRFGDVETSNSIPAQYQHLPERFVFTTPSAVNQMNAGSLKQAKCFVGDEIEQVIASIFDPTIDKRERNRVYATVVEMLTSAERVFLFDADAGSLSYHFIKTLRSDVTFIVNDYHDTHRKMLKYKRKSDILKAIEIDVLKNYGLIAIACASEKLAQDLGQQYSAVLGAERVLVVTAKTKHEPRVKEFLEAPDQHAGKYALIIYSSCMGSGVDISKTKPRAVYSIFARQVLTGWDMHQMTMRFRHAETYHVWVDPTPVTLETDAAKIEAKLLNREKYTRQALIFERGIDLVEKQRRDMVNLKARVKARCNRSLVDVHGHFWALAERRYTIDEATIHASPEEHEQLKEGLAAIRAERQEEDNLRLLNSAPVDHTRYKQAAARGMLTPELEAGHTRYCIEETYAQSITRETIADYDEEAGIARLLLLETLYQPEGEAKAYDAAELQDDIYAGDLTHAMHRRNLLRRVISPFMNGQNQLECGVVIEFDTLNEYMATFLAERQYLIYLYFGWRRDYSMKPINLLRFMLGQAGLKLVQVRRRDGIKRYCIEPDTLAKMVRYLRQRKVALPKSVMESYTAIEFDASV